MEPTPLPPVPARPLPATGILTFLFTDVEESTPLWEQHEALMRIVTARHDALLDAIITAHGGQRVKERGEGDSLFVVFSAPDAAVAAALAMEQAVLAEPWPAETPIRVRMGLHTGLAQLRAGDYYGPVVIRCARIRGLAHGGQVLLSAATAALVRDTLPAGASLRSLGAHKLKGITDPAEVFQLCHPDLPAVFPALLSSQAPLHNLPETVTTLVGREAEQGEVLALLGAHRLVTLTGAGGVGKTRLALAVGSEMVDQEPAGVWLVELAPLAEPRLLESAILSALGLREEAGKPLLTTLVDHLKDRQSLLVLDNCEHLIDACAAVVAVLLRTCARLRLLATSRERLAVAGESIYQVPSLSVPDPGQLPSPELITTYDAVRLFVERAQAQRSAFHLTATNATTVAAICARLNGIPLAIELAAARVSNMPLDVIAQRLDQSLRLLTGGVRTAPSRQQTLRGALDWSWELLAEPERILLRRLAVFAGGWTLAATEQVCAGEGIEEWDVADLLSALVNKSLALLGEWEDVEARYRLLEPVRQYARERLTAAGEDAALQRRHLDWCLALAEAAAPQLSGPEQSTWLDRLQHEHDNLRVALEWCATAGEREAWMRLAAALWPFWLRHGDLSEGRQRLATALAGAPDAPPSLRAHALLGAGALAFEQSEYDRARSHYDEALALFRAQGDARNVAAVLGNLGKMARSQGQVEEARTRLSESLAISRELHDTGGVARTLGNLGSLAYQEGDYAQAQATLEECLAMFRELGDRRGISSAINNLALVALEQRDFDKARELLEEALALERAQGSSMGIALALHNLGEVAGDQGEYARARNHYVESLALWQALGAQGRIAECLEGLARLTALNPARSADEALLATTLCGAAGAVRTAIGAPLTPSDAPMHEATLAVLRATLGEARCAAVLTVARERPLDVVVAEVLSGRCSEG